MTVPIWMLLGFAAWTLLVLLSTIGVYRWVRILSGQASINDFRADGSEGADWYKRSMRAHANCVENLPVFATIVLALFASKLSGGAVSVLSIAVLGARVMQSLVHICFEQTKTIVALRFGFFLLQIVCYAALLAMIVNHALLAP